MAELKTRENDASVEKFLNRIADDRRRRDAFTVLKMLKSVTRKSPRMWGPSIVGFDQYHYKYDSGREGDMCMIGFSPRAQALTFYLMPGFDGRETLLARLGRHKTGKGCLYIRRLEDVDMTVLEALVSESYRSMKKAHSQAVSIPDRSDRR